MHDMKFNSVICDWLSFRHDFQPYTENPVLEAGKILKIDRNGVIENEIQQWEQIKCSSSDTSIRIKCDGKHIWFQGNIGRFREANNLQGHTLQQCFDKAATFIRAFLPGADLRFLGTTVRDGTIGEYGTYLTRVDLAANFHTDEYLQLSNQLASRRIGQRVARIGKYGPTWGYDTKRGQYWKAKLYDKLAELGGLRTPHPKATTARFEVQLGSEYLRQKGLNKLINWKNDMEKIVYGKFASQAFAENATVETWTDIPTRLRQHAIMWRDGVDPKTYMSKSAYYRVRAALLEYGVDISSPCNVMNLTQRVRTILVHELDAYRQKVA
ncbi:phage/plasmid replication domain-containing protein [Methylobacillus methanolivorans]